MSHKMTKFVYRNDGGIGGETDDFNFPTMNYEKGRNEWSSFRSKLTTANK